MKIFITGGISSGKSDYAEKLALSNYTETVNSFNGRFNPAVNIDAFNENALNANAVNAPVVTSNHGGSRILHFIATAKCEGSDGHDTPADEEMSLKIKKHREKRSDLFIVHENYADLQSEIEDIYRTFKSESESANKSGNKNENEPEEYIILVDSLTMWLSSIFKTALDYDFALESLSALSKYIKEIKCSVIAVADALGFNLVPPDAYLRKFIELNGIMEQKFSELSDKSYLVVAGNPIILK